MNNWSEFQSLNHNERNYLSSKQKMRGPSSSKNGKEGENSEEGGGVDRVEL